MAGPGVALRLHEFKVRYGSNQFDRLPGITTKVPRQGTDVRGLYHGQLGRMHIVPSKQHRVRFASLDYPLGSHGGNHDDHQRGFDLQTFRALDALRHSACASEKRPPETAYQEEFGLQSTLLAPENTKFTLYAHPGPMKLWSDNLERRF
ncbi:protein SPMIP3-like [Osmerus mordax]|uniref:protein SPMIP3-like n=1 Tax=Osmerus mordax TaxID=8014 RepID=UPI00350FCEAF